MAVPVKERWERAAASGTVDQRRASAARLKSLRTLELRIRSNPLSAGQPISVEKWPKALKRDYGQIPNLFRFELADRWRGYYSLIGETGGVRAWVLYLWDHEEYSRQSGYSKI